MNEINKVMLDSINELPEIKTVYKYWYNDNAFKSSFLHALSSLFPGGELFFLKSLKSLENQYLFRTTGLVIILAL